MARFRFGRAKMGVNVSELRERLADAGIASLFTQLSEAEQRSTSVEVVAIPASAIVGWNHQETFEAGQRILAIERGLARPALLLELRTDQTVVVEFD